MAGLISQAKAAISQQQRALVSEASASRECWSTSFTTSARCARAMLPRSIWQKSQHAHAIEILKKRRRNSIRPAWLPCHWERQAWRIRQLEPDTSAGQCSMRSLPWIGNSARGETRRSEDGQVDR
jgi:hypothetical protein